MPKWNWENGSGQTGGFSLAGANLNSLNSGNGGQTGGTTGGGLGYNSWGTNYANNYNGPKYEVVSATQTQNQPQQNPNQQTQNQTAPVNNNQTASTSEGEFEDLLRQFTSLMGKGVGVSTLPTNLGTGQAFTPSSGINRNYSYGASGGGNQMLDFLRKKGEGLGLLDPLSGFNAFKFMGGQ